MEKGTYLDMKASNQVMTSSEFRTYAEMSRATVTRRVKDGTFLEAGIVFRYTSKGPLYFNRDRYDEWRLAGGCMRTAA